MGCFLGLVDRLLGIIWLPIFPRLLDFLLLVPFPLFSGSLEDSGLFLFVFLDAFLDRLLLPFVEL